MRITCFLFLCLLLAVPAWSGILYDNGPIDGTNTGRNITSFIVTDSFALSSDSTVTGIAQMGIWALPGDTPLTVNWAITSDPLGGTSYGSGTSPLTLAYWGTGYGGAYSIYDASFAISLNLSAGNYWLQLSNGVSAGGYNIYWDVNSGPSTAYQADGSGSWAIDSEAFQIIGTSRESGVPEPASLVLFGSGLLLLGGLVRRRLS